MDLNKPHIGVLGGGSWGTALIKLLSENTDNLHWWVRSEKTVSHIKSFGKNPSYLRSATLPKDIDVSTRINTVMEKSNIIVIAIPSAFLRDQVQQVNPEVMKEKVFFSAVKGIVPGETGTITQLLHAGYRIPLSQLGVVSGPCHSEEVAMEKQSFLTIGAYNTQYALILKELLATRNMIISVSNDVKGIEYASILKNIIAIASGISVGLGYGDNFQAVLIANAVEEMKLLLNTIEKNGRELSRSVYLGDVIVTAFSKFSRNRMLGNMLGKGYSLKASLTEMNMIAEGYYAAQSVKKITEKYNLKLPVMEMVYNVLYNNSNPNEQMQTLAKNMK